jgi:hypothetical protein
VRLGSSNLETNRNRNISIIIRGVGSNVRVEYYTGYNRNKSDYAYVKSTGNDGGE